MRSIGYWLLAGSICTVDQFGKSCAEKADLPDGGFGKLPVRGVFLRRNHNEGAAFQIGQSKRGAVCAISVCLTVLSGTLLRFSLGQRGNGMLRLGLSMVLGGAFSNTYDRLKRKYVVDYISFDVKWRPLRNTVFNLADFAIITGALLATLGAVE